MEQNQKQEILRAFDAEKQHMAKDMERIYKTIAKNVSTQPTSRIVQSIPAEESTQIGAYIRTFRQTLKAACQQQTRQLGFDQNTADIIWANVMQAAGMPRPSLCESRNMHIPSAKKVPSAGPTPQQKQQIDRLANVKKTGIGVAAVGTAAVVATCLIVPGWTGAIGAAKAAGILVVGSGILGAVVSQKQAEEIDRLTRQPTYVTLSSEEIQALILKICGHQHSANVEILGQWVDAVCAELLTQCEQELRR